MIKCPATKTWIVLKLLGLRVGNLDLVGSFFLSKWRRQAFVVLVAPIRSYRPMLSDRGNMKAIRMGAGRSSKRRKRGSRAQRYRHSLAIAILWSFPSSVRHRLAFWSVRGPANLQRWPCRRKASCHPTSWPSHRNPTIWFECRHIRHSANWWGRCWVSVHGERFPTNANALLLASSAVECFVRIGSALCTFPPGNQPSYRRTVLKPNSYFKREEK